MISEIPGKTDKRPRVIAVTSGKGGVGKTSVSVNLAIALARTSSRVCLFDADMSLANVNIMLGVSPHFTLEHVLTGEKSLDDIMISGPKGVKIVPGASGFVHCVDWDQHQQRLLVSALQSMEPQFEYIIIDTAAGISPNVMHFIGAAQLATVVITPEPTSLTDAFSLLKALKRRGYKRGVQVILNMAQDARSAARIYRRFEAAVDKYLGLPTEFMGSVWMDPAMRNAVSNQQPVTLLPSSDPSCRTFFRLAQRLVEIFDQRDLSRHSFAAYWQRLIRHSIGKQKQTATPQQPAHADTAESRWQHARTGVSELSQHPDTTPEQILELMTICLRDYKKPLGGDSAELALAILHKLQPDDLKDEQKLRLILRSEQLAGKQEDPALLSAEKHQYDEKGFGDQEHLIRKIRASSSQQTLNNLLESIRYASLARNSD
ncbi:hypothetical protein BTA51_25905 [Hahella sp. CCB-MM4]|nr:hypothetical protein BTA51_25905 [Hahella sp. CCB-MM4]